MPQAIGDWLKQSANASFYNAVICLGLYTSARVAEQVKAGILSLRSGQRMAGLAMGLTLPQTYRYVLLPMAFRIILPPLGSEFLNIIKNSSVALTIGLIELTAAARSMAEFSFQVFEAFTGATLDLHHHQHRCRKRHALARTACCGARLHQHGPAGGGALRTKTMFSNIDWNVIIRSLPYLFFDGMRFTIMLTLMATAGGIVIGTLLAMARLSNIPGLSQIAGTYVNLIRSMPLVLVIFWFYFLVPYIGQWITGASRPIQVGAFLSALVTFTLFEAAYFCEIMRAGIQSIPRGQVQAAQALGMPYWTSMGEIILPQAFRNMLPILLTQTIILFQDTSLVYVISVTDFLGAASKIAQRDGRLVEMYLFAAVVYFVISLAASYSVRRLQNRIAIIR